MLSLIIELPRALKLLDTGGVIRTAAFSPEPGAAQLVTGGAGGRIQRWNARKLQPIGGPLPGPQSEVLAVAYSPEGQRIAAGDPVALGCATRRLWDGITGKPAGDPLGTKAAVTSVRFSRDGLQLLSGGACGTLEL